MSTLLLFLIFFIRATFYSQKKLQNDTSFSDSGLKKVLEVVIKHYKANNGSYTNIKQEILDSLYELECIVGENYLSSIEKLMLELILVLQLKLVVIFGPDIDQNIFGMEKVSAIITLAHIFEIFFRTI